MTRTVITTCLLLCALAARAQDEVRYVSDEITVSVRSEPSSSAESLGFIDTGTRVTVQRSLGPESYSRVITDDGLEGWVPSRFLSEQPAAQDHLASARRQLSTERQANEDLQQELARLREQLSAAAPAFELAGENQRLRETITELQRRDEELQREQRLETARRDTLVAGASIAGVGILVGLLLPMLRGGGRKRYDEL